MIDAALERLSRLHPRLIDLSLGRMHRLLATLGDPQHRLPPVVHVAGTNGKGSTVAFLRAMAEAAGLVTHVYTSPHLVRFNERIRVAGRLISDEALAAAIERVEAANAGEPITFFEVTTAIALVAFSETPADLVILEVGLGGVLDATNVVDAPALSVITPIDIDHREFLGDTIEAIAGEKAGILKAGRPAVIARQSEAAMAVIEARAARLRAPLTVMGQGADAWSEAGRLVVQAEDRLLDLPGPSLRGAHQVDNAGLAALAALALGLPEAAIAEGVRRAVWPARLQRLTRGPHAAAAGAKGAELWLDGGHNPHAARALAQALAEVDRRDPRPLVLVAGMLANKDAAAFFAAFAGLAPRVVAVSFEADAATPTETLAEAARGAGLEAQVAGGVDEALTALSGGERVVICGSLYLAGEVLGISSETWPT